MKKIYIFFLISHLYEYGQKIHDLKLVETLRRQQNKGEKNPVKAVFKK